MSRFRECFEGLAAIGRDPAGGWSRCAWTAEDADARAWFTRAAEGVGLEVEADRNGSLWAWWRPRGAGGPAVATGSHLDTVPNGGAYDGALGAVSGLLAVEELRRSGFTPARPLAVVAFADEEGARFGTPTFASRLSAGALDPAAVRDRRDAQGVRLADALAGAGLDPGSIGPDRERLDGLAAFVELHVEQGRGLADLGAPVAVATAIWAHGRWRLALDGEGNHAGTTRLSDRRDPTLVLAAAVLAARARAAEVGGVATVGRMVVTPNGTNAVPSRVEAWLDARTADEGPLEALVERWTADVARAACDHGVAWAVAEESRAPAVRFDAELSGRISAALAGPPPLPTAAGHDAGALATRLPTAMLFVRNPTGVSHSPAETAAEADCLAGVAALRTVLEDLAC